MESLRKSLNHPEEMDRLKRIIKMELGLDIMVKSRCRKYVDARMIYSKILKDRGYTLQVIGNSIKRDHTVIVHYIKTANALMGNDENFYMSLVLCRNEFNVGRIELSDLEKLNEIQEAYSKVSKDYEVEKMINGKSQAIINKYNRFSKLIDHIDRFTPNGEESFITNKLIRALN